MSGCYAVRCNDEMQCGHCGIQWRVDDTDPPTCKNTGVTAVWVDEFEPAILALEPFNALALVKKLSSGVRSLSRADAALCCAIARASHEEGVKEGLKAAQRLKVVLQD